MDICVGKGPTDDMFEDVRIIGDRQYQTASVSNLHRKSKTLTEVQENQDQRLRYREEFNNEL